MLLTSIPIGITSEEPSTDAADILWWYDLDAPSFGSAASADIDDDGYLELVFGTYFNDEHVYALNANNGTLLWKYDTGGCNDASPVIYDVDLDGDLEVILPSSSPYEVYCFDGKTGTVEWSTSTGYPNCLDSPPAIADVDNDDKPEIILGAWYGYVFCLNGEDGEICWQVNLGTDSYIQAGPNILDVNDDGQLDVVVAQYSGDCRVYSLYGNNGTTMWYSALPSDYMYHGGSFADIDEDGNPEIAIGCYDNHVYVFNAEDGSLAWDYIAPNYIASPTSLADLNNDDHIEIVFTSYNYLGVLSNTGELLWDYTTGGSMFRGASISDTNNDGVLDVIFGADDGILRVVNGDTGDLLWDLDLEDHYQDTYKIDHAPVIEDFDNDDTLDIFIIGGYGSSEQQENNHGRCYAIDAGAGTGPGWPMFRHDIHHSACFHYTLEDESIIYVDDDAAPSWYDATHVKTIQEGINNASNGYTISVYPGIYYEHIIIDKTLSLIGTDKHTTIIDGQGYDEVVQIIADTVLFTGFTITNSSHQSGGRGLNIYYSQNHTITNNIITQNYRGLFLYSSNNNTITFNEIHSNNNGILGGFIDSTIISNNNISNNDNSGINLNDLSNSTIENNTLNHNGNNGLNIDESVHVTIKANTISHNPNTGIYYRNSTFGTIIDNIVSDNDGYGIWLHIAYDNLIYNNEFNNSNNYYDDGINIWNISKTVGTNIIGGPYIGGNYWSDYLGEDIDSDGLGDTLVPHGPGDHLPLVPITITLDVDQSTYDRGFPVRHALDGDWGAAQNFNSTLDLLLYTEIYLRRFGSPEFDLIVELRTDHPQGPLLDTKTYTPSEVALNWEWLAVDFSNQPLTEDEEYFIVLPPAPSGVTTSFGYEWAYAFGNQYDGGSFWFTRDGGGLWRDLPTMYEFTFRIYGIG